MDATTPEPPPQRTAFEEACRSSGQRGKASLKGLDAAPDYFGDMAEFFGGLTPERLAGCWVSCITNACIGSDLSPGDMARALVVVAERLHGVTFKTEVQLIQSRTPTGPEPTPKAAVAPKTVGKYTVHGGEAPEPAGRKTKAAEAIAAVLCLPETGGWFEWVDGPKTFSSPALSKRLTKAAGVEVLVYRSTAGKVIVKRIAKS